MIEIFTSTRVQILSKLVERPFTISEIAKLTGYSKTTVSYHLNRLYEAGLVERMERGKWVYYRITERGRKTVKVEKTVSAVSIVTAAISLMAFAAIRVMKKPKLLFAAAEKRVKIAGAAQGFEYEYLLLLLALATILLFLFLKFRR
ncbi:winged helix-turn-helix domain-containing protein [Archaeoglobus neptunius]|uniref:winged helix-turn-helix domain-containing protein n=1 Tax=Archaeoglobus neptunius TaxID=2798580 RepID=UPI001925D12E